MRSSTRWPPSRSESCCTRTPHVQHADQRLDDLICLAASYPTWTHGKRRVVEAAGSLTINEFADRSCDAYGCSHEPHLTIPEEVA
jgi:hypothetical protein